jgi:DNA-binding NtrC family response regulator
VDVRVVAATNRDLDEMLQEGRFREDLYYRLNVIEIALPPLRQRPDDIVPLAEHILAQAASRAGGQARSVGLSSAAQRALLAYHWPGNVRELKHVLERALAFAGGEPLAVEHLPPSLGKVAARAPSMPPAAADVRASVRDFERERITEALHKAGGNRTKAAQILGLPRRTLVYKLSKMRIPEE